MIIGFLIGLFILIAIGALIYEGSQSAKGDPASSKNTNIQLAETYRISTVPEKKPEPSCLAKGIAAAWIKGEGWEIKRSHVKTKTEAACSYYGNGNNTSTHTYQCRDIKLIHAGLDIIVSFEEYCQHAGASPYLMRLQSVVAGKPHVTYNVNNSHYSHYGSDVVDASILYDAIRDHPYPAFKRLKDAYQAKQNTQAVKIKAVEALGCMP
jgi:hypothetical protein